MIIVKYFLETFLYFIQEKKKSSKKKHLLSDIIQFDDVANDDDFFFEDMSNKNAEEEFEEITSLDLDENSSQSTNLIDVDTKTEAFRHIIAGACMSMGLKFAGSFNQEAYETLVG